MELENLGFIAAVKDQPSLEVSVLNFYANPNFFNNLGFKSLQLSFFELVRLFFSIRFLKIYIKSGFKMRQSMANLALNFPEVIGLFLEKAIRDCSICFAGIRPGNLLHFIHDLAVKNQKPIAYHEISKFNFKHYSFFQKVNSYGTFLISGYEKKEDLLKFFPNSKFLEIRQWIYDDQDAFLNVPSPKKERLNFGSVSRLDFGKNIDTVFRAVSLLKKQKENLKFILFGDGPELPKLQKLAKELDIEPNVEFRGAIKFEDRSKVFSEIDVFIMSSSFEGGPLSILEAMASARPIISTNVGDVRNRIVSGITGYILDSIEDYNELAQKMSFYIYNPELINLQGQQSRRRFLNEFDQDKNKTIFLNTLNKLISC
ncbi:hypothetical protein DDT91_11805 [Algoriphagus sp. AK58]|nr:hypothetical protein [Algoriphagus sp. AK58]